MLGVDSNTVVVLIHPAVALQEKVFEGHGVLLLIGHHQLVVEAEQDELQRKQYGTFSAVSQAIFFDIFAAGKTLILFTKCLVCCGSFMITSTRPKSIDIYYLDQRCVFSIE